MSDRNKIDRKWQLSGQAVKRLPPRFSQLDLHIVINPLLPSFQTIFYLSTRHHQPLHLTLSLPQPVSLAHHTMLKSSSKLVLNVFLTLATLTATFAYSGFIESCADFSVGPCVDGGDSTCLFAACHQSPGGFIRDTSIKLGNCIGNRNGNLAAQPG